VVLALNDLIGGQVHLMFPTAATVAPHVKSGRLRALAVTGAQPSVLAPALPTVSQSGVPGYEAEVTHGMFAPAGTPAPIVTKLNEEIVRTLGRTDVRERFLNAGIEAVGSTPDALAARMKSEMVKLGKMIRDAGIRAD